MTDCEHVRPQLTGYLDGDVDAETGAVVRGHLRECAACRDIADAEAALRDGLRSLPSLDPPPAMWNAVRARLADAEVADAHRPAWRRAVARWGLSFSSQARATAPYAAALAAAALAFVVWRSHHDAAETEPVSPGDESAQHVQTPAPSGPGIVQPRVALVQPGPEASDDVTVALAHDSGRRDDSYRSAATDLERQLADAVATWSDDRRRDYDAKLAELQHAIDGAHDDRARHSAWRAKLRFLQRALVRDEVALASISSIGPGGGGR